MNTHTSGRKLLSWLRDQLPPAERFDLEIFNRTEEGPIDGLAPVRIGGTFREIVIYGVGEAGVSLLQDNVEKISRLLTKHFGGCPGERRRMDSCAIHEREDMLSYLLPICVFQRNNFDSYREAFQQSRFADPLILNKLRQTILSGIQRQALMLQSDTPEFEIYNLSVERLTPIEVKNGRFNLCAKARFVAPVYMKGPWHVGHLCSRGFGQIFLERKHRTKVPENTEEVRG
mgnify:FL=1